MLPQVFFGDTNFQQNLAGKDPDKVVLINSLSSFTLSLLYILASVSMIADYLSFFYSFNESIYLSKSKPFSAFFSESDKPLYYY